MIKILFLSANPKETSELGFAEQVRAVQHHVLASEQKASLHLEQEWVRRTVGLRLSLRHHNPDIVHFVGRRGSEKRIALEDHNGASRDLKPEDLNSLFSFLGSGIQCAVLDCCGDDEQAHAIVQAVPAVVSIDASISERLSTSFCSNFYVAMAQTADTQAAFHLATKQLSLNGVSEDDMPVLLQAAGLTRRPSVGQRGVLPSDRPLTGLDFGAPAAERDIAKGLRDYFIESDTFRRVSSGEKFIILGNRGSGKSAIFKILAERERQAGNPVIEVPQEDFSYQMLSQEMAPEKSGAWAKQGAYAAAWKYLLYILIMKGLTEQGPRFKTGDAAKIYNYLRDNHKGFQSNPIAVLVSYLKRMEGIKIGTYEASLRSTELIKLYKLEEIQSLLEPLTRLCEKRKVLVLVDELDQGWNASEDAKAFVAGLFHAVVSINQRTPNLRVLISLRMELYENIPAIYEDAQKYRDVMEIVSWDCNSLLELISKRIRHCVPSMENCNDAECWRSVFAERLGEGRTGSFEHIVGRTLYRPREIIEFCTDALQESRRSREWPIGHQPIDRAELKYSDGRTKDIAAEYNFQYPGLMTVFEVFRGKSGSLRREYLEELCLRISIGEIRLDKSAEWAIEQDPEYLIEVLWRIGFLQAWAPGRWGGTPTSDHGFYGPHQVSNLHLRNIDRFRVHPMFWAFLGIADATT